MKTLKTDIEFKFNTTQINHENYSIPLKVVATCNAFRFDKSYHVSTIALKIFSDDDIEVPLDILSDEDFHAMRVIAFKKFDNGLGYLENSTNGKLHTPNSTCSSQSPPGNR